MLAVLLATVAVEATLVEPSAFGMKDEGDATLPSTSFVEKKVGQERKVGQEAEKKVGQEAEAMMLSFESKGGKVKRKVSRSAARMQSGNAGRCDVFFNNIEGNVNDERHGIASCGELSGEDEATCQGAFVKLMQVTSPSSMDSAALNAKYDWRRVYLAGCMWNETHCNDNGEGFICERHSDATSATLEAEPYGQIEVNDGCPAVSATCSAGTQDCAMVRDNGHCNCPDCTGVCDSECGEYRTFQYGGQNMYGPNITVKPARDFVNPVVAAGTRTGANNNDQYPAVSGGRSANPELTGAMLPEFDRRNAVSATPITVEPLHPDAAERDHNDSPLGRADRLVEGGHYQVRSGVPRVEGDAGNFQSYDSLPKQASDKPGVQHSLDAPNTTGELADVTR